MEGHEQEAWRQKQSKTMPELFPGEGIEGAKVIGIPIVWTEQYRKGLGPSNQRIVDAIAEILS